MASADNLSQDASASFTLTTCYRYGNKDFQEDEIFYILLIWGGVRTHPTHPPAYGPAGLCFQRRFGFGQVHQKRTLDDSERSVLYISDIYVRYIF